ncbi:MAG: arsenical-resistance protein [Gammaproteobacteria bacterium]|nr:arsenical-resistance protein [Gammaproteobacteria bacterium]
MGLFERFLSVWVFIAIMAGVLLGKNFSSFFAEVSSIEIAHVNLVVAVLIWVMIYPMMTQVDFSSLKSVREMPQGILLTCFINWLLKPFSMAILGWLFFKVVFAEMVDPQVAGEYIAGMILLGVAPCTAMVFVWSQLTKGDPNYTLVQVSVNDIIMIFAFAPISAFLLGVADIEVPWETLLISVVLYVLLPLVAGVITRRLLDQKNDHNKLQRFLEIMKPLSILGLLGTVVLLFGFQANTILDDPFVIILIATPLLLQTYGIFFITLLLAWWLKLSHRVTAPACLIATSNFFELAVAVAISLFGLESGASLATVVGVLVEVPVMLSLVAIANRLRPAIKARYEASEGNKKYAS